MNPKFFTLVVFVACLIVVAACKKNPPAESEAEAEWSQMDAYHMVMAEAFHPFKDSSNLAPAKGLAPELATAADQWTSTPIPEKINTDEVRRQLEKLKADSHAFADHVKASSSDEQLGKELTALHATFHELMEAWSGKEKHDH
jgi:hypothetical protein